VIAAEQLSPDAVVATIGERRLPPFAPVPPTVEAQGTIDAMALRRSLPGMTDEVIARVTGLSVPMIRAVLRAS
jgi:hypothetical protein